MKASRMSLTIALMTLLIASPAMAQQTTDTKTTKTPASKDKIESKDTSTKSDDDDDDDDKEESKATPNQADKKTEATQPTKPVETKPATSPDTKPTTKPDTTPESKPESKPETKPAPKPVVKPKPTPQPKPKPKMSPISDLAKDTEPEDFKPLQDIEEETIDPIFPAKVYPHLSWDGQLRVRNIAAIGFDLGTGGTSATLPPADQFTPLGNPANPTSDTLWSTDFNLKLEPTLHIAEDFNIHLEIDLLNNMVMGAFPINQLAANPLTPDPSRNVGASGQYGPREADWFNGVLQIREAYGEIDSFFGTFRAGRMDNHWGLGMFFNNGDCLDCNFGDHIDRAMVRSKVMGFYGMLAIDFPGEGVTTTNPNQPYGQPLDMTQVDDIDQFTLAVSYQPLTRPEIEKQNKLLNEDRKPIFNGGLLFSMRDQEGTFTQSQDPNAIGFDPNSPPQLVWQGLDMYLVDGWVEFLYNPSAKRRMRIGLEINTMFGTIDNATKNPVGQRDGETGGDVNCFNEDERRANETLCLANSKDFFQLGLALESEFSLGGPISFGFNAGYASGGSAPNWGYNNRDGQELDFFRFDPDYHVDLILFRRVIGTVTNAFYFNPYIQADFLKSGDRKMQLDVDMIVSRAANQEGTPAGNDPWLGFEIDSALRWIMTDTFHAAVQGGILFPLGGLNAVENRPSLTTFGTNTGTFTQNREADIAWTLQFHLNWQL